ncbi:palmitoyltransferase swf1 [Apophysomyces sp. BC1034]|nr:palmitoyltransferase swf1 [Apophysomyces sp. BC1034]
MPYIPGIYLHPLHLFIIPVEIVWLYASYYIACTAEPGTITKNNVQSYLDHFPYDHLLYQPKECRTCKLQKPARSKHCSMCKACIGKSDHHCAWINRCVGVNNHRYFFFFLFTLTQLCTYGAYLCFQVYRGLIIEWGLDKAFVYDHRTGTQSPITFRKAMLYILHRDRIIGAIGILAIVVAVVVFIFTVYQLYLAGRGITTNEAFKWDVIEEDIQRGLLWQHEEEPLEKPCQSARKRTSSKAAKDASSITKKARQVTSLEELDNIYDAGFFRNLLDIFIPPQLDKP